MGKENKKNKSKKSDKKLHISDVIGSNCLSLPPNYIETDSNCRKNFDLRFGYGIYFENNINRGQRFLSEIDYYR